MSQPNTLLEQIENYFQATSQLDLLGLIPRDSVQWLDVNGAQGVKIRTLVVGNNDDARIVAYPANQESKLQIRYMEVAKDGSRIIRRRSQWEVENECKARFAFPFDCLGLGPSLGNVGVLSRKWSCVSKYIFLRDGDCSVSADATVKFAELLEHALGFIKNNDHDDSSSSYGNGRTNVVVGHKAADETESDHESTAERSDEGEKMETATEQDMAADSEEDPAGDLTRKHPKGWQNVATLISARQALSEAQEVGLEMSRIEKRRTEALAKLETGLAKVVEDLERKIEENGERKRKRNIKKAKQEKKRAKAERLLRKQSSRAVMRAF